MSLRLSPKHGVNPAVDTCFLCGKDKGLVLFGCQPGDKEAPRKVVANKEPCQECQEFMKQGIILISTRDGESGDNPYRTGGFWVLKQEACEQMFTGIDFNKQRVVFIEDNVANKFKLPR